MKSKEKTIHKPRRKKETDMAFENVLRFLPTAAVGAAVLCVAPARAQQPEPNALLRSRYQSGANFGLAPFAPPIDTANADNKKHPKKSRLEKVLADMRRTEVEARQANVSGSSGDGFTLIAESSITQSLVSQPKETTTAATIEGQLDKLVKELPHGTRWVKLMLPLFPSGKTLKGDDLADFALAQARMYGSVGEAILPPGSVEVLSQPLASDKAKAVVPALNLRPLYLLVNPDAHYALTRQSSPIFTSVEGQSVLRDVVISLSEE